MKRVWYAGGLFTLCVTLGLGASVTAAQSSPPVQPVLPSDPPIRAASAAPVESVPFYDVLVPVAGGSAVPQVRPFSAGEPPAAGLRPQSVAGLPNGPMSRSRPLGPTVDHPTGPIAVERVEAIPADFMGFPGELFEHVAIQIVGPLEGPVGPGGPFVLGPGGPVTLSAIEGSTLTQQTEGGWTKKVQVNAQTQYRRGNDTIQLGDLKVGDLVQIRDSKQSDGSYLAVEVRVILPRVSGEVTAVNGSDLTIKSPRGDSTVRTNAQTKFTRVGQTIELADVTVGTKINAVGTKNGDGSLTATQVDALLPLLHGKVTAKTNDTLTLDVSGQSKTVRLDSNTKVHLGPGVDGTLNDVTVGATVGAAGLVGSDGTLTAQFVHVMLPHLGGRVTAKTSDTLTLDHHGETKTIRLDANTRIQIGPNRNGTIDDVNVGSNVDASGRVAADGTMTAVRVHVLPAPPAPGGPTPGGPGGGPTPPRQP